MSILDDHRNTLVQDIDDSLRLVIAVNLASPSPTNSSGLNNRQIEQITEWSFVNVLASWEKFLENCFLAYMTGTLTLSGFTPARYVLPTSIEHANKMILSGRDFFQWSKPARVCDQAELCFENGEPFRTALEGAASEIAEMTIIRNEIVHKSKTSSEKFNTFLRNIFRTVPPNITPGQLLVTIKPKTTGTTFMSFFYKKLKVLASKVVPN